MNTDKLPGEDTLLLLTHQEAIRCAQKNNQLSQFKQAHSMAGKWAKTLGLQLHDTWLEDHGKHDHPYAAFSGVVGSFPKGMAWLLSQGWTPGEGASVDLLCSTILANAMPNNATPETIEEDGDFFDVLAGLAHHDAVAMAGIAYAVLGKVAQFHLFWKLPRTSLFLEWIPDDAILRMQEQETSLPEPMERLLNQRKAKVQSGALHKSTAIARARHRPARI